MLSDIRAKCSHNNYIQQACNASVQATQDVNEKTVTMTVSTVVASVEDNHEEICVQWLE